MPGKSVLGIDPDFELHVITRQKDLQVNTITVISTFRTAAPWGSADGIIYEWDFEVFHIFMKALVEESEVVFGGMEPHVRATEKARLRTTLRSGANAFQLSRMASDIVGRVASRTHTVGAANVSIVIPTNGYVDTNLWSSTEQGIVAYLPCIVWPNGSRWGPSNFPVDLSLISDGHYPKHSLFFKSIVQKIYKRSLRRVIFRRRKGPQVPGIMGMIGLVLFGSVKEGYEDFGLSDHEA